MIFGPLNNISPSEAIFILTSGIVSPTVPNFIFLRRTTFVTGVASVIPNPSNKTIPEAAKNSPIFFDSGAPPEIPNKNSPPKTS